MTRFWNLLLVPFIMGVGIFGCGDPATKVGEVCQVDDHCGSTEGTLLLTCDHTLPGGSCAVGECTPDDPATKDIAEDEESCPDGSRCVQEFSLCILQCKEAFRQCKLNCAEDTNCSGACNTTESNCKESCPVKERTVCRRSCEQQSECRETIVCRWTCETVNETEVCEVKCANEMECIPFWMTLPTGTTEDVPRTCILKGFKYEETQ